MFLLNKCKVLACNNIALSQIDESGNLSEKTGYCLAHSPYPRKAQDDINNYILQHNSIVGLNAQGMTFYDIDIKGKSFSGCDFTHGTFNNFHLNGCKFVMCIGDFSTFINCSFLNCTFKFTSLGGSKLSHVIFADSELIQNNFNGITAIQSSFNGCNLYNSRFIRSRLVDVAFGNCNLKKANFTEMSYENINFKISNTREAIFSDERARLESEATR